MKSDGPFQTPGRMVKVSATSRRPRAHEGRPSAVELLPPSPGEVLRGLLGRHGVTQDALAEAMGVSRYSVNQLVNDRRGITAEMALRMGIALHTSAEFWLSLQRNVDLASARKSLGGALVEIHPVVPAPASDV